MHFFIFIFHVFWCIPSGVGVLERHPGVLMSSVNCAGRPLRNVWKSEMPWHMTSSQGHRLWCPSCCCIPGAALAPCESVNWDSISLDCKVILKCSTIHQRCMCFFFHKFSTHRSLRGIVCQVSCSRGQKRSKLRPQTVRKVKTLGGPDRFFLCFTSKGRTSLKVLNPFEPS
jgi:hypothetical protein